MSTELLLDVTSNQHKLLDRTMMAYELRLVAMSKSKQQHRFHIKVFYMDVVLQVARVRATRLCEQSDCLFMPKDGAQVCHRFNFFQCLLCQCAKKIHRDLRRTDSTAQVCGASDGT